MGVKQLALAHALSVDQTSISRWEAGQQTPSAEIQQRALDLLAGSRTDDIALRRLVENSADRVHLVDDATHVCLAYSRRRAAEWGNAQQDLLGVSLWRFATEEIRRAEAELATSDWWMSQTPEPKCFVTSGKVYDEMVIHAGGILWERLYLSDGTPVRLVTGI
jgi:transcriptional regulator with XRE-family HTH domain